MLCVEDLLSLELFQTLPQERLMWVCDRAQEVHLSSGDILFKEGDPVQGFFVLMEGQMEITRMTEGVDMPLGQSHAPSFFGEIPVLTEEVNQVSFRAIAPCRVYRISGDDFRELLHGYRDFERMVFQALQQRLRGFESFIRNREKMASLGTLAAGLAHELNNPAAALVRALQDVIPAVIELEHMSFVYGQQNVEDEHTQQWMQTRDAGFHAIIHNRPDMLTLSECEDQLASWLEDYGIQDAWKLAGPLALGGVTSAGLNRLTERWRDNPTELRDMGIRWLARSFDVMEMITSGLRGAERISELVKAMKSYSHLDQGATQIVDIHEGIEDTLKLFSHKLRQGITIHRNYDESLPKIPAYGSELNQAWTNLLDNALDAIEGEGVIEISTLKKGQYIHVCFTDSGQGIPNEIQSRIFEPFFTTKAVGKGSGLGLEVVRRVIENRHRGRVVVESRPGHTTFTVCLPIAPAPSNSLEVLS